MIVQMVFFEKHRLSSSIIIGLLLFLVVISIWNINNSAHNRALEKEVSVTGNLVVQQFQEVLRDNVNRLENLGHRLEVTGGSYFDYWNSDASRIVAYEPSFKFVEWIDRNMIIQMVEPLEGNEEAVGLDISRLDYRNEDWNRARRDSLFNLTHWLELVQGDYAFLVDAPVYIDGNFQGTITAGMDFTKRFDGIMQGLNEYYIELEDEKGEVFYQFGSKEGTGAFSDLGIELQIAINDASNSVWKATIIPNGLFSNRNATYANYFTLALALTLCLLLAMSFYFWQKSSAAEKRSRETNIDLQNSLDEKKVLLSEIHHRVKNNLAIIVGLIELQKSEVGDKKLLQLLDETQHRIYSISGVHELLYETENFSKISFEQYVDKLIQRLSQTYELENRKISISYNLNSFNININQAIPLGMMFNELITNSLKHAFKEGEGGNIDIHVEEEGDMVEITYRDSGSEFDPVLFEKAESMGLTLIKTLLQQLSATYKLLDLEGFGISFKFPVTGKGSHSII